MGALFALLSTQLLALEPAPESVYVADVDVSGAVNDVAREKLQAAVRDGLARGEVEFEAQAAQARYTIATRVVRKGRDYSFELTLKEGEHGKVVADVEDRCEICGVDEVADLMAGKAAVLGAQISQLNLGPPMLAVTSTPPGAVVFVDGEEVGTTPLEGELSPGKHVVRLSKVGHVTVERELDLAPGVRSSAEFTLEPLVREAGPRLEPDRAWMLGWIGVGAGAAILGGGIGLLAVDDRAYKKRCSGENVDADGDCKFLLNTMWAGATAATVGGALVTAGVAFLLTSRRGRKRSEKRAHVLPTLSPVSAGLLGRF